MTRQDIAERLRALRMLMERQADTSLCDLDVPAALVLFDVLGALEMPLAAQVYVLGVDNVLRLREEYGIEWE